MNDKTIHESKPLNRHKLGESLSENIGIIILLLAALILLIVLMHQCGGNPSLAMSLADALTMVQI